MKTLRHAKGFTLIELVVLMIISGILAAYILPRLGTRSTFDERVFKDEIISVARYAQQLAMMRGRNATIRFHLDNTTKNYGIDGRQGAGAYNWLAHPNSEIFPLAVPSGISVAPSNIIISYDALGNVVNGVSQAITITGAGSNTICIDASGYAHEGAC
ncbi:MAG: prepilin-type N-terminal cleavage/methylation domain-containing protein [Gammaproteobacteria bacterium]